MEIKMSLGILGFALLSTILALWIWVVVEILKRDLCGPELIKWLLIIIIFPIFGFILYFSMGRRIEFFNSLKFRFIAIMDT